MFKQFKLKLFKKKKKYFNLITILYVQKIISHLQIGLIKNKQLSTFLGYSVLDLKCMDNKWHKNKQIDTSLSFLQSHCKS